MKNNEDYNDILSLVSHDLKSPLTAVMGALDLLALDDLTPKEKEDSIKHARKASKSILKLVENILVMAKLEAGKEHIQIDKVTNLEEHFDYIIKTFKFEAKVKSIKLKLKENKPLPTVYWDIDKLHYHVFNNIISNAIKFTKSDGKIVVDVKYDDENVYVHILDNGIGIPKEKQSTIFEKYDTHCNKKVFKGNGLGLYNAYNFVKQHKGTIEVTEGLDDKGIGFYITLPIYKNR